MNFNFLQIFKISFPKIQLKKIYFVYCQIKLDRLKQNFTKTPLSFLGDRSIIIFCSYYINLSFQQENATPYIISKENQFFEGVITNLDEKISKTQLLGFGLWFKWQPLALQDINIEYLIYFSDNPYTYTGCSEKFILSLQNQENKKLIYIFQLSEKDFQEKFNVFSDFFNLQEEISIGDYFEGVWVFFNSLFDFTKNYSTFHFYKSLTKELISYKVDGFPIFQNNILYKIGNYCDKCLIMDFENCFSRFEGRLSILFEQDYFDESTYLFYLENLYALVNDCTESDENIISGSQIYEGDFNTVINLGILEKPYFQLNGWIKMANDSIYPLQYNIIKIVSNFKENFVNFNQNVLIYYLLLNEDQNYIIIFSITDPKLNKKMYPLSYMKQQITPSILTSWHFVQVDIGYPDQAGSLKLYSHQLYDVIQLPFDLSLYTGISYGLYIGGDFYFRPLMKGAIANLIFKKFCRPQEQEFIVMCHYTCQSCFGPFIDNCLSCKSSQRRFLKNDQCLCQSGTFQFQEFDTCQTIEDVFKNLMMIEDELPCKLEGYDRCDDFIICSFGYFKYQESHCIQCPYYNKMNSDRKILCVNCLIDPDQFSITLTCTIDTIKLNQGEYSTYDNILRGEDDIECFETKQLKNKQFQLQLIKNKISNYPPLCRKGYYYENEECHQCSYGCVECESSILCSKCEEGYYLDQNNVCGKCQNCLKCEIKNNQLNCISCPEKYYLQNQKCFECGQFCADCRSNGYCNYCIDSQKYFISIDGINCLVCNIPNCKYCYQQYEIDNQLFYTSFNLNIEFYSFTELSRDYTIYCAKCQDGYILDLNTNTCIKRFDLDTVCQFGFYDPSKSEFECQSDIVLQSDSSCSMLKNCRLCYANRCLECQQGYYIDLLPKACSKCPVQCENCIFENKKLLDSWKIEILARYDKIDLQYKFDISSNIKEDYEIQCTSCPPNYILYNANCVQGCNDECLRCEIIKGQAKCVECQPYNNIIISIIDQNGQCLKCNTFCKFCEERSLYHIEQMNNYFIQNQENSLYTRSCFKPLSITGKTYFINQFTVIDCEKFNKCKRKGIFTWNIYCDNQQFQKVKNKRGFFQEGNYYFDDFFENEILSQIEIKNLLMFFNEQAIEQIEIILNIYQGNTNSCKLSKQQENLIKIHSSFIYNIFFFQGVNLKVLGQQQNVLFEELIIDISGFQQIQFENLIFANNQINITDTLMNSISFINCSFENNSQIKTLNPYNLTLINVTLQMTNITQNGFFQFNFKNDNTIYKDIKITINGLRIINSKFSNTKFINIITEIGPKASIQINNLQIIKTNFDNSFLIVSSTSSGLKNMFFGNFTATNLNVEAVNFKNSILLYLPNVQQLNISNSTLKNLRLQSSSYFILSNQLNCFDLFLDDIYIDNSYLFSNKVPPVYQTNFGDLININLNQIQIQNVLYIQEQSLLQVVRFNNYKVIVNLNQFMIENVSQIYDKQNFITQEISSIHISCSECFLNQIDINRTNGIPEISIIDSELIIISNCLFTQNEKQAEDLIKDCQTKIVNQLPYFIYIGQYQQIRINNLTIINSISFNYPFFILKGIEIMQKQISEYIEIINSKFENNKLITSESNSPTSIIEIDTKQKSIINLTNLTFQENHLNMEIQDLITQSTSTLLINAQLGILQMNYCLFQQNVVTNSTDSTLYLKAKVIEIINSRFIQNNILNFQNLFNRIQLKTQENSVTDYYLKQVIKVLSNGGSGYLLTSHLSFVNCLVEESYSLNGGAFYVNTFGDAQILIENSTFVKTISSLQSSASSNGGCFYIDAQVSKLTLIVKNSTFNQSYSRSKGGCFYIVPSTSYNFIQFEYLQVINVFSTTSQFLDFSLQNLQDISSNVTFYRIKIFYDKIAFSQFLGLLEKLSNDEASFIVNNSPIINIKNGNITLNSVYCILEINIQLILIDQGQIINMNQIYFQNGFIWNSPFLSVNLKLGFQGLIKIQNLKILNLKKYQYMNYKQKCKEIKIVKTFQQACLSPVFVRKNTLFENNQEMIQQDTLCQNQNIILKQSQQNFSLLMIKNIDSNHLIMIQELTLKNIICLACQNGLLSLTNVDPVQKNNIILNGIFIEKCQCGNTGCLSIINKDSSNYLKINFLKKENRILQEQNFEELKFTFDFQVSLLNSKFIQNMADYGGAICIIDIDILISQCQFSQNIAKVGGAIYSFTSSQQNFKTILFSSFLFDNQAELATDIYFENQMLQQTEKLNVIIDNNSTIQGTTVLEKPRSLAIQTNQGIIVLQNEIYLSTSTKVIQQAIIKPYTYIGFREKIETLMFPSGQIIKDYYYFDISTSTNIPYNLSFRIIALNRLNQQQDQLNGSICTLDYKVINLTSQLEIEDLQAKLSINYITFDTSTFDFNLDNLIVNFNPYYDKEIVLRLYIQCDMVYIPIYDEKPPFLIKNLITDYTLFVDIKTFPCQLGEYFNSTSKICIKCNSDQSQYQVELNATVCSIQDETKIKSVESSKIELKPNFWRAYFYSPKIEECYHLQENCLGGWQPGDISCSFGHIGALCEQCDLYNIRGDGHFSTSSPYKCGSCDKTEENIISILLISLWTLISVLMSVNSTIDTIKQFIARSKFKLIFFGVGSLTKQSSTAVLIKVFTNYLQIIKTISTFQLKVPPSFTFIFTSVGNPMEQVAYGLDCFLISISDIQIIYFRVIWSFLMAIFYIAIFFLFLAGAILLKYIKFNISMITTALIYIFIFLQPNLIQQLISLVSFRKLSDIAWIQGNVAYRYDTGSHQFWMISFCIPILITLSLLIPQFMFYSLRSNKNHLEQIKTRETWGYLYNEYKLNAYYWEFIKIFQKELIIIFLAYYEDFIAIKASLVFLVIFVYSIISNAVSPYMTGELNRFDIQSTTICAVSIILGSSIYTAQNQNFIEIVYPFYIIIALINGWFLLKMIFFILLAYFEKLNDTIDKVKEIISKKFPSYFLKHTKAQKLLESKKTKIQRIKFRFAMIKQYLIPKAQKILKIKNETEIYKKSISCSTFKVDQEIQTNDITINKFLNIPQQKSKIFLSQESQRPFQQDWID